MQSKACKLSAHTNLYARNHRGDEPLIRHHMHAHVEKKMLIKIVFTPNVNWLISLMCVYVRICFFWLASSTFFHAKPFMKCEKIAQSIMGYMNLNIEPVRIFAPFSIIFLNYFFFICFIIKSNRGLEFVEWTYFIGLF